MKKNSGFTVVEVIVSFALTMIIVLFLFQLVITLKQVYTNNFVVSSLILKQSNISQMINKDFERYNNKSLPLSVNKVYDTTISGCYELSLGGLTKDLCYDKTKNTITYNDYEFELVKDSVIGNVRIRMNATNNIMYVDIPISYPDLDENYGIKAMIKS